MCGARADEMEAFLREHGSGPLLEAMQNELPQWREEDFPLDGGRNPGYTPFEYITFTDELIQHTLTVQVLRPSHLPGCQMRVRGDLEPHTSNVPFCVTLTESSSRTTC